MQIKSILNRLQKHSAFVYETVRLVEHPRLTLEVRVRVRDREETPNSGLVSTARCCGGRGIVRPTGSACARRRQGASLRSAPAFAGLTALTPAPRTPSRLALV